MGVPRSWPAAIDVLSVDLDMRERSAEEAFVAVREAARRLVSNGVFLKIDSTLRGPIAALVAGALAGTGKCVAMVAPAFPDQRRLVRDGRLVLNGQTGARVADLLGPDCVVVDADNSETLRKLAEDARNHPEWLLVGSAGLALQLAGPLVRPHIPPHEGPLLVVAGSPAAATRKQLEPLEGLSNVVVMSTEAADARDEGQAASQLADQVATWAARHEPPGAVVLTGGATARAVCQRLDVHSLRILGELQPGVPIGTLQDGAWHGITVVTKAGGFGAPETLLDVVRALGVSSVPTR